MKPLSEILTELGIAFTFPIEITDSNGNLTYYEDSNDHWDHYWKKWERDAKGTEIYYGDSTGYQSIDEYDAIGNRTYSEDSEGYKIGTPRSAKTCEGKVVEVDGIKYELKAL